MFKFPQTFDENEWFVLISMIILIGLFFKIPRIMCRDWMISIFLLFANLGLAGDSILGTGYPIDFYQIMDSPKLELFDTLVYFINYPLYGYFFAYMIYRWHIRKGALLLFVFSWCGVTLLIEIISVHFHVFRYHHGWNTGYSFLVYLVVYALSATVLKLFQRIWQKTN